MNILDLLRVVLEFNTHLDPLRVILEFNTHLDLLRVVLELIRLWTLCGSFRNLTQTMAPSGDLRIDHDRSTHQIKRKVVYRPP